MNQCTNRFILPTLLFYLGFLFLGSLVGLTIGLFFGGILISVIIGAFIGITLAIIVNAIVLIIVNKTCFRNFLDCCNK
ncbi:MAG: hypothetical protein PHX03_00095 [Bacilli bacterium]|nr:hypothetical protein [Bacilli bacterium]